MLSTWVNIHTYISSLCPLKGPKNSETPVTMSTPNTRSWLLYTIFQSKEPRLLGEMADFQAKKEKYKMNIDYLVMPESKKKKKKMEHINKI